MASRFTFISRDGIKIFYLRLVIHSSCIHLTFMSWDGVEIFHSNPRLHTDPTMEHQCLLVHDRRDRKPFKAFVEQLVYSLVVLRLGGTQGRHTRQTHKADIKDAHTYTHAHTETCTHTYTDTCTLDTARRIRQETKGNGGDTPLHKPFNIVTSHNPPISSHPSLFPSLFPSLPIHLSLPRTSHSFRNPYTRVMAVSSWLPRFTMTEAGQRSM